MFERGNLQLGRLAGVPVLVHWTLPLGALLFTRFSFVPGAWLGMVLLILVHEMGHAALVKACRLRVVEVRLHGLGGECRYHGSPSEVQRSVIAWGGVWAQAVLLLVALAVQKFVPVSSYFVASMLSAWIDGNLSLMLLNLVPIPPLDGAEAWRLPGLLRSRWQQRRRQREQQQQRARMRVVEGGARRQSDVAVPWRKGSNGDDESLPPMPDALKKELERITREATRPGRNDKN